MDNCMNQCINHSRSKRGPPIGGGGKPGGGPTSIGGGAMRPARFQKINMNIPLLKKNRNCKQKAKQTVYIHTYIHMFQEILLRQWQWNILFTTSIYSNMMTPTSWI